MAEELSVTAAAVSTHARRLEAQADVQPFWRSGRTVYLTGQGRTLLTGIAEAFAMLSGTFDRIGGDVTPGARGQS